MSKRDERRALRKNLCMRWLWLADQIAHLEDAIRYAPAGTFTEKERLDALFGLGEECWNGLVNYRPKLPASKRGGN